MNDLQGEQTMPLFPPAYAHLITRLRRFLFTVIGVSLLGLQTASAQAPATAGALSPYPTKIAVLDVKQLFEQHGPFKQKMKAIDEKVKKLQSDTAAMQKWASEQQKVIKEMAKGPNRDAAEAKVASEMAKYRVNEALRRKNILEDEASVYYNTWRDIEASVAAHCQRQRIDLVVRFDSRPISGANRGAIMAAVNRSVVHQDAQLNITPAILAAVNAGQPAARPRTPATASQFLPGQPRPRSR